MTTIEHQRLLNELEYYKGEFVPKNEVDSPLYAIFSGLLASQKTSPVKAVPLIRKAPRGPSRTWRNPALLHPPPAATAPSKILVNPNFQGAGSKILVNPNFEQPKKILVNPAFQQPKAIYVNPRVLSAPAKSPSVLFKSKNKLILKKQQPVAGVEKPKISPLIFKSKNKLVRRTTAKKLPTPPDRKRIKQGKCVMISGERFVSNGGTRLTRLLSIQRQAKQRSLSVFRRKSSNLPCTAFRKMGQCPKGDACERLHLPPMALFKSQDKSCDQSNSKKRNKVDEGSRKKKSEARYYQSSEQQESKAVRPVRIKALGELPAFIPL